MNIPRYKSGSMIIARCDTGTNGFTSLAVTGAEEKKSTQRIPNYVGAVVALNWQGVEDSRGEWIVVRQSAFKIFAVSAKGGHHSIKVEEFELVGEEGWTVRSATFKPETVYRVAKSLVDFIRLRQSSTFYLVEQAYEDASARIMDLFDGLLV